jgi:Putative phage serine protease XkdF
LSTENVKTVPVIKSIREELRQATFITMVPDEVDLHGDITTEEEVRKACFNFNKFCRKANLFHMAKTELFEFCESYIMPTDIVLGDRFIKKGTWVQTIQCNDTDLWNKVKSGEFNGLSIGAMAKCEVIE